MRACVLVAQSCLTLCDSMDYSPPGSSVRGISQARVLEGIAIYSSPGDPPEPGIKPGSPTLQAAALLSEPPWKPCMCIYIHIHTHTYTHT